ncbi:hypothetical protein L1887_03101 [Cichorium endivia]|nr:hypothetical protein L1887_03101 [Cichorium endivia]
MIATMKPELQRIYEDYWPYEMHKDLAEKFHKQARVERCEVVKAFTNGKPKDGESVCTHVQRMQGYVDRLRKLGTPVDEELAVDIVLNSLPSSYDQFTLAYHLNNSQTSLAELHGMLQTAENGLKEKVQVGSSSNASRAKSSDIPHVTNPKETDCFYCKEKGHWKRSCPKYLQDIKDGKVKSSQAALPCDGVYETVMCVDNFGNNVLNIDSSSGVEKACLWHCRLGHINKKRIAQLQKDGVLESFDLKSDDVCESCLFGKMTKSPFKRSFERGEGLLDIIHTDVCSPLRTTTKDGTRFYVTFTDDFSRDGYIYLIKHKSDTFEKFNEFKNEVENQLGRKIKMLRSDRGVTLDGTNYNDWIRNIKMALRFENKEYVLDTELVEVDHATATPEEIASIYEDYWPYEMHKDLAEKFRKQARVERCEVVKAFTNGKPKDAERRNRTLLDMVRSMMSRASLPIHFWGYALETADHILNLVPTKKVAKIPHEM